jgi:thiamine kinase-like enzyme
MRITVEEAIRRVPSWGNASSVVISPLPGGLTNFNYRVDVDGEAYHLRIWAERTGLLGIDRMREHRCAVTASRCGVAPEVVHFLPHAGITVTRFVSGRSLPPGTAVSPDVLARVVRSMRRYHNGPAFEGTFSPFDTLEGYLRTARRLGAPLPDNIDGIYAQVRDIEAAVQTGRASPRPCHNDLWGPNVIDDGTEVRIVDWEYAGMGDVCFDLANFAMNHSTADAHDHALLEAYFGGVPSHMAARLKLLKIVAELRDAMWYLVALSVSIDTTGFVQRAGIHFERCRNALADPRVPGWLDQAARV